METKIISFILIFLFIASIKSAAIQDTQGKNDSVLTLYPTSQMADGKDPLVNLGHISTQMLKAILEAEDQNLDIVDFSTFITALSKGAAILKYPEIYKEAQNQSEDDKLNKLSLVVEELKKTVGQTTAELDSTKQKLSAMEEKVTILEDELHNANNTIAELKGTKDNFVGFTAFAATSQSLSTDQVVNFSDVLFNYGDAYDAKTSVFKCPYKGIYVISANVEEYSSSGFQADAEILIGNSEQLLGDSYIFRLHIHDDSTEHDHSGGSAIVECAEGNRIRFKASGSGKVHGTERRSFFSIYLLKKL